jgi:hypothetical protein
MRRKAWRTAKSMPDGPILGDVGPVFTYIHFNDHEPPYESAQEGSAIALRTRDGFGAKPWSINEAHRSQRASIRKPRTRVRFSAAFMGSTSFLVFGRSSLSDLTSIKTVPAWPSQTPRGGVHRK